MSYISELENEEVDALREYLLQDFKEFSRFCFKILKGFKLIDVDYYAVLFETLQLCIDQKVTRMIINIPPRAGKTLMVSTFLPLFAWCRNPSGETILTGFNSDVLSECSGHIRSIMSDPDFQRVFPDVIIDNNKKSVEKLGTMAQGVIHAIPSTGKMTGKGCGSVSVQDFAGFMSIDDAIKPGDVKSPVGRKNCNDNFVDTLSNRPNSETTPIILIMQRLDPDDLCGFLMKGGTDDTYHWLNIPGLIRKETGSQEWYDDQIEKFHYTNVIPIIYDLKRTEFDEEGDSSFWPIRKSVESLKGMRRTKLYMFMTQYMGMPESMGKKALTDKDWHEYTEEELHYESIIYTFITADTASTTKDYSDFSVAIHWAYTRDQKLYELDAIIDKWEVPELIKQMRAFYKLKMKYNLYKPKLRPRGFYMEDKSSGLFLNQQFLKDKTVNVKPVARDGIASNDKFSRFLTTIPFFEARQILFLKGHKHTPYMKRELLGQTELGPTTGNDDVADAVADAVGVAFSGQIIDYETWD